MKADPVLATFAGWPPPCSPTSLSARAKSTAAAAIRAPWARLLHDATVDTGFDCSRVRTADDEPHAVRQVPDSAEAGDLVVIAADDIETCHAEVQRFKDRTEPLEVTIGDIPNLDHFAPGKPAKQVHPM